MDLHLLICCLRGAAFHIEEHISMYGHLSLLCSEAEIGLLVHVIPRLLRLVYSQCPNPSCKHSWSAKCKSLPMVQAEFNAPTRTTKYPREIPPLPWYRQTLPQMVMAGFLPFSAIYIELYYIYASVWGKSCPDRLFLQQCPPPPWEVGPLGEQKGLQVSTEDPKLDVLVFGFCIQPSTTG